MAITIRYDTKQRILEILRTVEVVVKNTVAPATPKAQQDFEGYVFSVSYGRATQRQIDSSFAEVVIPWQIRITSPLIATGLTVIAEDNMLRYADALHTELNNRPRLENSERKGLAFVDKAIMSNESGISITGFPAGESVTQRYTCTADLTVTYTVPFC